MKDLLNDLLLVLNIKAEKKNTVYSICCERAYSSRKKMIYSTQRVLKFCNGRLFEKIPTKNMIDTINYLNNELKIYN